MLEKQLQSKYTKWKKRIGIKEYGLDYSHIEELKIKKKHKRLNFKSDVRDHQIPTLIKSMEGCVYHKISDMSPETKPSDTMQVCYSPMSPLIVGWWEKGKKTNTYFIDPRDIQELQRKGVKSITEEDATNLAYLIIEL